MHLGDPLGTARADEGHDGMHVVEGIVAGRGEGLPVVGHRRPAIAHVLAAQMQPPQQRRRIEQVHRDADACAEDRAVEQPQHLVRLPAVEMIEREMPPVMDGEEAVAAPRIGIAAHPGDAVAGAALHLQHMGHRVLRPAVARLELDGAAAGDLGRTVVAHLLQPEGVHAQERVIARHVRRPVGQRAGDAVAQEPGIAGEEVDLVTGLQRQQVVRMVGADPQDRPARLVPACPRPDGRPPRDGPSPRGPAMRRGRGVGGARGVDARRLGAEQIQPRLQQMGHGEAGAVGERRLDGGHRIAAIEAEQAERRLVVVARAGGGAAQAWRRDQSWDLRLFVGAALLSHAPFRASFKLRKECVVGFVGFGNLPHQSGGIIWRSSALAIWCAGSRTLVC